MNDKTLKDLKHIIAFKEASGLHDLAYLEVPPRLIIPAGMLLKHMSETDWENMKAFIRGEGIEEDD